MASRQRPGMKRTTVQWLLAAWLCCGAFSYGQKQPAWPQFLGPQRTGISAEKGLLTTWPEAGVKVVWRKAAGVGMSGISVADGKAITLYQDETSQYVVAHDAKTGEPVWKQAIAPAFKNQMGNGPRATPTIDGDHVFVFTGQGRLAALELKSGKILWKQDPIVTLKGKVADYGMASSPLVVGDNVIVTVGASTGCVVAYQKSNGKLAWKAGKDPAGYSSASLLKLGGAEQVVAFTGNSAIGIQPASGKLLWRYPYITDYECNIATPLAVDGKVFLSSGENHGSVLLEIKSKGGQFEPSPVWESQGRASTLRNEWQTSILMDGHLYGLDNVGSAGPVTHLTCVNAKTGERVWQQKRFGKANLIYADGKLVFSTMKGEVVVALASKDGYKELGRQKVLETTRQAPALAGGLLYLRDDQDIVCLDLRKK